MLIQPEAPTHSDVKKKFIRVVYEYNKNPPREIKESFTTIHRYYLDGYDSSQIYISTYKEHHKILAILDSGTIDNNRISENFSKIFNEYLRFQLDYYEYMKSERGPTGAH